MKKLSSILFLLTFISIVVASSIYSQNNIELVGKWKPVKINMKNPNSMPETLFHEAENAAKKMTYIFKNDSTFEIQNSGQVNVKGHFLYDKSNKLIKLKGTYLEISAIAKDTDIAIQKGDWKSFEKSITVKELVKSQLIMVNMESTPQEYYTICERQ